MRNILIINGHQPYPFSPGRLTEALIARMSARLSARGYEIRHSAVASGDWDSEAELDKHLWADTVIWQYPINWMGAPWSFKKYMDEVYTAGMDGRLCAGDGRRAETPQTGYGTGGTTGGKRYMISVTLNAPRAAFDSPDEPFFAGASLDDLLYPQHQNAKFFAMTGLPSFAAFDVMKNPDIAGDFARLDAHLDAHFPKVA